MKADNVAAEAVRPRTRDLARGTNQSGVRLYNERLVLSLIRRHASLPKAEIARLTGLSPQTITDHHAPARGGRSGHQAGPPARQGRPAVGSLRPQSGRRLFDRLQDRPAQLRPDPHRFRRSRARGRPRDLSPFRRPTRCSTSCAARCRSSSPLPPKDHRDRVERASASPHLSSCGTGRRRSARRVDLMQAWRDVDIRAEIERLCPWPVYVCNDATAACAAELVFGNGRQYLDFLYVFIGWFIGGGVVLNGSLFPGRTGYAGALGSLPIPHLGADGRITPGQLLNNASTCTLERRIREAGGDPGALWESPENWSAIDAIGGEMDRRHRRRSWLARRLRRVDHRLPGDHYRRRLPARGSQPDHRACPPKARRHSTGREWPPSLSSRARSATGARAIGGACLPLPGEIRP